MAGAVTSYRTPKGVYVRPSPDWYAPWLQAGSAFQGAVAGQLSYVALYNNASDGAYLVVVGFSVWTFSANSTCIMEAFQGLQGTPNNPSGAPIDPSQARGPGIVNTFTNPACIGSHIGELGGNNTPTLWPYAFPAAIVPPGWNYAAQAALANVAQQAGFWWYYTKTPY